jgi:MFS family permease
MTAYMLGLAIFVPMSGRLADRWGTRTVFAGATALFLVASLLCGLAGSVGLLVAARFLQGMGGAMMAPVGRLIVMRSASRAELVEAMALVLLPAMVAPMIGPAVGGLIVTCTSWRWIFLINIPLGLVAMALILRHVDNERHSGPGGFDPLGTLLVGACFAAATLAVEFSASAAAEPAVCGGLLLASLLLFAAYTVHARRHAAPVLDLGLLRSPSYRWAMLGGSLYRIGVGGLPFLLPVALQLAYGLSALASGLVVLLPALGGFAMKFFTTRILRRFGYRSSLIVNGALSAVFLAVLALARPGWPLLAVAALLVLFGLRA